MAGVVEVDPDVRRAVLEYRFGRRLELLLSTPHCYLVVSYGLCSVEVGVVPSQKEIDFSGSANDGASLPTTASAARLSAICSLVGAGCSKLLAL